MPVKLSTTIKNLESLENPIHSKLIFEFYIYLKSNGTPERYQNQNIKALINFAKFLGQTRDFFQLSKKEDMLAFLNTKIKNKETDPDGKWMRTWNDYLQRIKNFIRWLHNEKQRIERDLDCVEPSEGQHFRLSRSKKRKANESAPTLRRKYGKRWSCWP